MNTIKFNPLDGIQRDTHIINEFELIKNENIFLSNDKYKFIFNHVVLHIFITTKCNSNCDFCMNKQEGIFSLKELKEEDYLKKLEKTLINLKNINPYVILTGGEPTLNISLLEKVVFLLNKYDYKVRTFSTNGYLLNNPKLLSILKNNNITKNINISRHHVSDIENNKLMRGNNISNNELNKLFANAISYDIEPRLSSLFIKKGVYTLEDILNYIDYFEKIKCKNFLFRENIFDNNMCVKNIEKEIKYDNRFTYKETLNGFNYLVNVYTYKNYSMKFYYDKKVDKNIITNFVFLPNGHFYINYF